MEVVLDSSPLIDKDKVWIKSFARRSGLNPSVDKALEKYSIHNDKESIAKIIASQKNIQVEIGFGRGENILHHALNKPDVLFIGCEPYLKGVSNLLISIEKYDIKNILVWVEDARDLVVNFPDNSIEKFFILFPDPWPKRNHNKRRLINVEFLTLLSKKMLKTGSVLIATDHQSYAEWIALHINQCDFLTCTNDDFIDHLFTKYHKKALKAQRKIHYFKIGAL